MGQVIRHRLDWKNSLLINERKEVIFFLEIICNLELEYDTITKDSGKCTKCIDACPTDAQSSQVIDAINAFHISLLKIRKKFLMN